MLQDASEVYITQRHSRAATVRGVDTCLGERMSSTCGCPSSYPKRAKTGEGARTESDNETAPVSKPSNTTGTKSAAMASPRESVLVVVPCSRNASDVESVLREFGEYVTLCGIACETMEEDERSHAESQLWIRAAHAIGRNRIHEGGAG